VQYSYHTRVPYFIINPTKRSIENERINECLDLTCWCLDSHSQSDIDIWIDLRYDAESDVCVRVSRPYDFHSPRHLSTVDY
jgi:hypothetical protein